MKLVLGFTTVLLTCLSTNAAHLLPAGHSTCLNARMGNADAMVCADGKTFYSDQDDRCGCLSLDEITPADICIRARIFCDATKGESFSSLYAMSVTDDLISEAYAGCGCFSVREGMHAFSER